MSELVSVIVATYHRDSTLREALNSLGCQTYSNIEIILVDDNAELEWNLGVEKIVANFKKQYPNVKLVYSPNELNLGSARTRNLGIHLSNGKYVTFLDDDDVYLPQKIENQLSYMKENGLDFSVTDLELYYENGKFVTRRNRNYIKQTDASSLFEYHLMYHITGTDTLMFKREYLVEIGGFMPIDVGDEFYLMQRAIEAKGKFGYLSACDVRAVIHTEGEGLSSGIGKIQGENQLYEHKKKYFMKLSKKSIRYIKMRHYAVIAFAEKRRGKKIAFLKNGIRSVLCAPIACIKMLREMR